MEDTELKYWVKLYRTTKDELDALWYEYEEGKVQKKLFEALDKIITEKYTGAMGPDSDMWNTIYAGRLTKEHQEVNNKYDAAYKKFHTITAYDRAYLTAKLDCIKEMLGDEMVRKLEAIEEKKLLE
jgi:hypothetical protein